MNFIFLNGLIRRLEPLGEELRAWTTYVEFKWVVAVLYDLREVVGDDWLAAAIHSGEEMALSWVEHVQNIADMLYDWIDEVEINNRQTHLQKNQVSSSLFRFKPTSRKPKFIYEALADELQYMVNIRGIYGGSSNYPRFRGESGSFVDEREVIGRRDEERAVMNLIERGGHQRVSVIPIVGFFGVGKTTLAQLIFQWDSLRDLFCPVLWQSLYKDCPDTSHWLRQLSKAASSYPNHSLNDDDDDDDDDDTQDPKMELQKHLENKRFFIVLDDFEDNILHKSLVRELIATGSNSGSGSHHTSVIIVVTHSRRAAASVGTMPAYQLDPLPPKDFSDDILDAYGNEDDRVDPNQRHGVVRKIMELSGGIPSIVDYFRRDLERLQDFVFLSVVPVSFIPMIPWHLKQPLQSFHLQKACGLGVEALICLWMALGFLYSDDPAQQPEQIGRKYLTDLVDSALCPHVEYAPGGVVTHLQFNDALFNLYTATTNHLWCFIPRRKSSQSSIHSSNRYIIWDEDNLPESLFAAPNKVRLFILCIKGQASAVLIRDIVSRLKCLRVLGFGGCDIKILPDSIGKLNHLRYLDVGRNTRIKSLPDSICDLWYLQTLFLHGCSQLVRLPVEIGRLQNLRYLTLTFIKESLPEAIGKLTSLRTLALASCPKLASLPRTLKNLKKLETLGIVVCPQLDLTADSSVEGLKGIDAIQTLLISHLPKFASLHSDLGNPSVAMKHLTIQSCPSLKETRWVTQFRTLRSLTLEDCPQLSALIFTDGASQFDDLVELVIRRCPSLGDTTWITQFMSLRSLIIDGCSELAVLDAGFSELKKLERLEIRSCPRLTEWFASPTAQESRHISHVRVIELDGVRLES